MSPARDFGDNDNSADQPGDPDPENTDHPTDKEDHEMTTPDPIDPDQPHPERAIEAPTPSNDHRDIDAPTAGQLYQMFPDAFPTNSPERRKRHLAAVPDPGDVATLPAETLDDDNDPLIATALRWRAVIAFWWRPTAAAVVFVVVAMVAFFAAGTAVGIAWCVLGIAKTTHSIWDVHGRPSLRQFTHTRQGGNW
ncbi:hypothetical protein GZH49_38145 [Nocardia terpenica]|uniref:hypothetical protein n=1 Tax=Nocardia terpenica TaxID=455432 RepID=UPI002FDFE3EA